MLHQHGKNSALVPLANEVRRNAAKSRNAEYLNICIPENEGACWADDVHLSDQGLRQYMEEFERQMTDIMTRECCFTFQEDDFPIFDPGSCKRSSKPSISARRSYNKNKVAYNFLVCNKFIIQFFANPYLSAMGKRRLRFTEYEFTTAAIFPGSKICCYSLKCCLSN